MVGASGANIDMRGLLWTVRARANYPEARGRRILGRGTAATGLRRPRVARPHLGDVVDGHDVAERQVHLGERRGVPAGVVVAARVLRDDDVVVEHEAVSDGGLDAPAGGDTRDDHRADAVAAEDLVEPRPDERAVAVLVEQEFRADPGGAEVAEEVGAPRAFLHAGRPLVAVV